VDLPDAGIAPDLLRRTIDQYAADDVAWRQGRSWSLMYDSPQWHSDLVREAAARFANENALSHTAFPSAARFESDVISMVASVVSPDVLSYGLFTSGGTESTMVAMKAYRDAARRPRGAIVIPVTAHPAFGKAAAYLGLDLVTVAVGDDGLPDPDAIARAVDERTVVVGLSAPCYPFGVVDPIAEVAAQVAPREVGVHVDAALGGMFLPFLDAAGSIVPHFGVDISGVTSVAVDVHKYGYGAKGASVVLFANPELRHAAYHVSVGWPGGAYASSGVLGTRSVGAAAGAFAALATLGRAGYRLLVADVMRTTRSMQQGMCERLPLRLVGDPGMSVFAVTSSDVSVPAVAHGLQRRGWWIDVQAQPPSMHFIVFPRHAAVLDRFLDDVGAAIHDVGSGPEPPEPLASYGVMVRRSAAITEEALRVHLDERFDARGRE
jgi:glutamate/tyrosine decarboxylase-like PLP-dependent enzyme